MSGQHGFDSLNSAFVRDVPRRGLLRSAGALVAGLLVLGEPPWSAMAKRNKGKGQGKGKRNGKPKPKPKPKPSCDGGACAAESLWAGNEGEINHCRFICEQCQATGTEFCIRKGTMPDGTPTKVADCCEEGQECCDEACCEAGQVCCGGQCCDSAHCCNGVCCRTFDTPGGRCCTGQCVNTWFDPDHCGDCNSPCADGLICVSALCLSPDDPADPCGNLCPGGMSCCTRPGNGDVWECAVLKTSSQHCGACNNPCPPDKNHCFDGRCHECPRGGPRCPPGPDGSGGGCFPRGWKCCDDGNGCPDSHECCIYSPINGGGHYCSAAGDCPY